MLVVKSRGCFVSGVNRGSFVAKIDASPKFDRRSSKSQSKKKSAARHKTVRRLKIFKSDTWYESAALSMAIGAKS